MKEKYTPVREVKTLINSFLVLGKSDQNTKNEINTVIDNLPSVEIDPDDIPKAEEPIAPKPCPFCWEELEICSSYAPKDGYSVLVFEWVHPRNNCFLDGVVWLKHNDPELENWNRRADEH